jgi:hypothetical protein
MFKSLDWLPEGKILFPSMKAKCRVPGWLSGYTRTLKTNAGLSGDSADMIAHQIRTGLLKLMLKMLAKGLDIRQIEKSETLPTI